MRNYYDQTCSNLIESGWTFSHFATVHNYGYSGTIGKMCTKRGYEYCRVYTGKTYNKRITSGYWLMVQITRVYKRPCNNNMEV